MKLQFEYPGWEGVDTTIHVKAGTPEEVVLEAALQAKLPPGLELYHQGWQVCLRGPTLESLTQVQTASATRALQMRPTNLEDVYLKLTGQDLGDNE